MGAGDTQSVKMTYVVDTDGALKQVEVINQAAVKGTERQKAAIKSIGGAWTEMNSAISLVEKAWGYAGQALEQAKIGEKANNASKLFKQMYNDGDALVGKLKKMTFGEISEVKLEQLAAKTKTLGIDMGEMGDLAKYAYGLSVQKGEEYDQTLDKIVTSLGGLEVGALKSYGILVDQTKVYDEYAEKVGKTTDKLTAQEKQTALVNEATAGMADAFKGVDFEQFEHGAQNATVALDDLTKQVQKGFADAVANAIEQWDYASKWVKSQAANQTISKDDMFMNAMDKIFGVKNVQQKTLKEGKEFVEKTKYNGKTEAEQTEAWMVAYYAEHPEDLNPKLTDKAFLEKYYPDVLKEWNLTKSGAALDKGKKSGGGGSKNNEAADLAKHIDTILSLQSKGEGLGLDFNISGAKDLDRIMDNNEALEEKIVLMKQEIELKERGIIVDKNQTEADARAFTQLDKLIALKEDNLKRNNRNRDADTKLDLTYIKTKVDVGKQWIDIADQMNEATIKNDAVAATAKIGLSVLEGIRAGALAAERFAVGDWAGGALHAFAATQFGIAAGMDAYSLVSGGGKGGGGSGGAAAGAGGIAGGLPEAPSSKERTTYSSITVNLIGQGIISGDVNSLGKSMITAINEVSGKGAKIDPKAIGTGWAA